MTPAQFQRTWPAFGGVLLTGITATVIILVDFKVPSIAIPAATMTFGVVVSGFAATQRNMLLTMHGSEVLAFAARTGYYRDILAYFMDGIRAGLLVTSISLFGFFTIIESFLWYIWLPCVVGGASLVVGVIARNEILVGRLVHHYLREQEVSD